MTAVAVPRSRRLRGDGGAVIVEAALVLPIVILVIMGLVEYSVAELQGSQATSASRDGARVGILDYEQADQNGSAANTAVKDAVSARLDGQANVAVDVKCLNAADTVISCSTAVPDNDRLRVIVSWPYKTITAVGLGVPSTIKGTSQMALVGQQVTVSAPPGTTTTTTSTSTTSTSTTSTTLPSACAVNSVPTTSQGNPSGVGNGNNSGELKSPLTIGNIVINNDSSCGTPKIRIWPGGSGMTGASNVNDLVFSGSTWSITYPGGVNSGWQSSTPITFQILTAGDAVLGTYTFHL